MTHSPIFRTIAGTAAAVMLCASMAQAASLKASQTDRTKGFKAHGTSQTQQVQQGCEDEVTQTSYMGPCKHHDSTDTTIVIEGCHNNETQTSTMGPCPKG